MEVVLIHEWLTNFAGSEKVVAALRHAFPGSPVLTSLFWSPAFPGWDQVRSSFLQPLARGPGAHVRALPVLPLALRTLRVPAADLVITSFHTFALYAPVPTDRPHVVYCHTPPRFLWAGEQFASRPVVAAAMAAAASVLRPGDRRRGRRPAVLVANSASTAARCRAAYGRTTPVVHPPVEVKRFSGALGTPRGEHFVVASRLVPYKRVDLVVAAFAELAWPLVVAGRGRQLEELRRTAPPNVRFVGHVPDEELPRFLAGARAVILPGEEDFGILPVEAMAAGTPVVAFGRGGARETVTPGLSGVLFDELTPAALAAAVRRLAAGEWDPAAVSASVKRFGPERFTAEMTGWAETAVAGRSMT
ncbi:MAG: glycosyltransferase [Acidimicrobiales bacterium]